jgi:hypothetical protein
MYSLLLCCEVQSVCIFNVSFKGKSIKYFQFCASTINMVDKSKRTPQRPSSPTVHECYGAIGSLSKELLQFTEKAEESRQTRKQSNYTTKHTTRHFELNVDIDRSRHYTKPSPFSIIQHSRKLFCYRRWFQKQNSWIFFALNELFHSSHFISNNNCESWNEAPTPWANIRHLQDVLRLLRMQR